MPCTLVLRPPLYYQCVIAPLYPSTIGYSTFSFSLDRTAVNYAEEAGVTQIAVELLCNGDMEGRSEEGQQAPFRAESGSPGATATKGFVDFKGTKDHSYVVSPDGLK
jgi:hypothetical protein